MGSASLTYGFLHRITNNVKGYYRVKVVDLDGEIMYSTVEEVKAQSLVVKLSAYPSPTTGLFKIKIPTSMKGSFNLELYDEAGRLVVFKKLQSLQGPAETSVDITGMAAGNYQVVCRDNEARYVTRIIKK